eukprot:scaffold2322_cov135-Cylindrotheca_fusiformis.AAC.25
MHRPRRRTKGPGSDGVFGRTSFSNPGVLRSGGNRRKHLAMAGAVLLAVLVGVVGYFAISASAKAKSKDSKQIKVGHEGFTIDSDTIVSTAKVHIQMMTHTKTGLNVMAVQPDDANQDATFGISFRTPLDSDRGLATIVEHAVQAGSESYPVKDPINQLKAGSLQTHLETWSERDRSNFVFASRNLQDYKNSMSVILDGIFHPLLDDDKHEWIYRQEGWRLETKGDEQTLALNGNAYNRARAAQMFPDEALNNFIYQKLFVDHSYQYTPKGLWNEILSGVRAHMIDFYQKWYQPHNARVYCYGEPVYLNACLEHVNAAIEGLEKKDEEAGILPMDSKIEFKNLDDIQPVTERVPYPSFQSNKDFRLAMSWVINDRHMDQRTEVAWLLIKEMLIGSATAIVAKEVEGLGDDYIGEMDTSLQQWVLTMGVSGLAHEADAKIVQGKIYSKLADISQNGFDMTAMRAALNKVEFQLRDLNSEDGEPQGVHLFKKVLPKWNYDLDPKMAISLNAELTKLRDQLEDPDNIEGKEFILELVTKGLMDNTALSIATIYPSTEMQTSADRNEIKWLNDSPDYWDKEVGQKILGETATLHRIQEAGDSPMDVATIPRLSLKEVNTDGYDIPTTIHPGVFGSDVVMIENEVPDSNGIAYVDFAIDISNIEFKDILFVPLMCRLMAEAGTTRKSDVEIQQHIDQFTGGLTIEPIVEEVYEFQEDHGYKVDSGKHMVTKIVVRTSCFAEKGCAELFNLINTVVYDSKINKRDKIINILQDIMDDMEDDLQRNGQVYTTRRIDGRYSLPGFIREQWFGITNLYKTRAILAEAIDDSKWEELETRLLMCYDNIKKTHHSGLLLSITGDKESIQNLQGTIKLFFKSMLKPATQKDPFPDFGKEPHPWVGVGNDVMNNNMAGEDPYIAFLAPTLVNDVGKGGILYQVGEHISGADMAVTQYLGGFYLNEKIRFNLGADKAWAQLDMDAGVMIYQSEETPSIAKTVEVFESAAAWVQRQMEGTDSLPVEAQAAIVGAVGKMDGAALQPNRVGYEAMLQYLKQDTKEGRQKWREEALGATKKDFLAFVNRLAAWGSPSFSAITNEKLMKLADAEIKSFNFTTCQISGYTCPSS